MLASTLDLLLTTDSLGTSFIPTVILTPMDVSRNDSVCLMLFCLKKSIATLTASMSASLYPLRPMRFVSKREEGSIPAMEFQQLANSASFAERGILFEKEKSRKSKRRG